MNNDEYIGANWSKRNPEKPPVNENRFKKFGKVVLGIFFTTLVVVGISEGVKSTVDRLTPVKYSPTTTEWVAGKGDGTLDAAYAVGNVDDGNVLAVKKHIEAENVEALKDGLDFGESLTIHTEVIPDNK